MEEKIKPQKIFIKPASPGLIIRHHKNLKHIIAQEGEWVVDDRDWQRELLQGSIVLAEPNEPKKQEPSNKSDKHNGVKTKFKEGDL